MPPPYSRDCSLDYPDASLITHALRCPTIPGTPLRIMSAHAPVRALTDNAADTVRGILLVALSYLILTIGDTAAKWAIITSGVAWAMLWRGAFGGVTVAAFTGWTQGTEGLARFRPVRWKTVALRSGLSSFTTITWYLSWQHMQLAETYALGFTAPLIMTVLAVPMLGERIRWRRALSTLVGFAGVLVMVRPGGIPMTPVVLWLLAGIVAMAVTRIMARQLSRTETPECQAFWLMISHGMAGAGMLLVTPVPSYGDASVWGALLFLGVSSGLAHCVFTRAYGMAPVSALAPYEYTMLLWGGVAGFVVFGEVPTWTTLAGAAIVALAGLYNLHRERVRRAQERRSGL
jgi:drug/metabolite transporter (DMT)-like permease